MTGKSRKLAPKRIIRHTRPNVKLARASVAFEIERGDDPVATATVTKAADGSEEVTDMNIMRTSNGDFIAYMWPVTVTPTSETWESYPEDFSDPHPIDTENYTVEIFITKYYTIEGNDDA